MQEQWNDPNKASLKNCTPHAIHLMDNDDNIIMTIEPSGIIPRTSN